MNWLWIVILLLFVGNTFWGYKKGLLRTAFSLISWILVLGVGYYAAPLITDFVMEKTNAAGIVQEQIISKLSEAFDAGTYAQIQDAIPEEFQQLLFANADNLMQDVAVDISALSNKMVYTVLYAIISIVIVFIAKLAIFAVDMVLGIASKLPLIGSVDTILGAALGAAKGLLWCWLVLAVIAVLALTGTNTEYIALVQESAILTWLYDNNIIVNLVLPSIL